MPDTPRATSLRAKIIAWSFVPTVLILAVVAMVNLYSYQRVTEDLVIQRDRELTRLLADQLGSDLARYVDTLSTLARYPAPDQVKAALLPGSGLGHELDAFDAGLVMLDAQGRLRTCFVDGGCIATLAWDKLGCVAQARDALAPRFSDILVSDQAGPSMIVLAVPAVDLSGQTTGVAAGLFYVGSGVVTDLYQSFAEQIGQNETRAEQALYRASGIEDYEPKTDPLRRLYGIVQGPQFAKLRSGITGVVYVVDSQGRIIYHPDTQRIGALAGDYPQIREVLQGRTGALRTTDAQGAQILASYAPVPGTAWGLVAEESWQVLLRPSTRYGVFLLVLLGLGIVIPTLVVTAGVRRVMRPLAQLNSAAARIAAGEFSQSIQLSSGDELQDLATQFNRMSQQLQTSYDELEQRVQERTAELTSLNRLAIKVSQSLKTDEIMAQALQETLDLLGLTCGLGFTVSLPEQQAAVSACQGIEDQAMAGLDQVSLHDSLLHAAIETREPVLLSVGDGHQSPGLAALLRVLGEHVLCIPLIARQQLVGVLLLADGLTVDTVETRELLSSIGHQTGLALENALLYDQAQQAAVLDERQRLARDLHDSVTQTLYGASLYAQAASRLLDHREQVPSQALEHLEEVRASVSQALRQMRLLIFELRPSLLDEEGLAGALRSRLETVEARAGLETLVEVDDEIVLDAETEESLYLICTEALNNATKHAQAQHITVRLKREDDRIVLDVQDDGVGFDVSLPDYACGFGLPGLRERAARMGAELAIRSAPGQGTTVHLEIAS